MNIRCGLKLKHWRDGAPAGRAAVELPLWRTNVTKRKHPAAPYIDVGRLPRNGSPTAVYCGMREISATNPLESGPPYASAGAGDTETILQHDKNSQPRKCFVSFPFLSRSN
ncbi:hypothetical protein ElyMa_001630700 [Elysia marginata]|uniref:Uncharacterized protein n=1 Tax=Elysia marginata TaxID=1093978 RepID=A0AAV4JQ31_9GAST|nr:hypothetical protein ElyMa_001630700 [Elysia marginata]